MFKSNTVFVVGAGASSEFGLPLGAGLSKKIIHNLSPRDDGIPNVRLRDLRSERLLKRRFSKDPSQLARAFEVTSLIRDGLLHAQSIDSFIDMHSDKSEVAVVGKQQIAIEILRAENSSTLRFDRSNIYNRTDFSHKDNAASWLRVFAEILLEKARANDLQAIGRGVAIVCFNYDRCIEHYLIQAVEATLGVSYQEAHKVIYGMNIIHPYESLGELPDAPGAAGLAFGADVEDDAVDVWSVADRLSTFTEEMRDQERIRRVHDAILTAGHVVFLGFGFQSQNVQLLTPEQKTPRVVAAISTGVGLNQVALREVRGRIARICSGATLDREREAIMLDAGCGDAMRHNRLSLSAF